MTIALTTLELTGLVLSTEFALIALLVPAALLRRQGRQAIVERADADTLLEQVEAKEPSRREALATIFTSTYGLDGAELEAMVAQFIEREQAFYQVMTSVYLERDSSRLKVLPEELTKLISPWLRLTPRNMVDASSVAELENTNTALSAELAHTQRSMSELMEEYSAAFRRSRPDEAGMPAVAGAVPQRAREQAQVAAATGLPSDFEGATDPRAFAPDETAIAQPPRATDAHGKVGTASQIESAEDVIDVSVEPEDMLNQDDLDALFGEDLLQAEDAAA